MRLVERAVRSQLPQVGPVGVHDEDLPVPVPIAVEGDLATHPRDRTGHVEVDSPASARGKMNRAGIRPAGFAARSKSIEEYDMLPQKEAFVRPSIADSDRLGRSSIERDGIPVRINAS